MERIGIAASKIAKGNLLLYNSYVVLIAFLLSVLLFLLAGSSVFLGLWALRLLVGPFMPAMSPGVWNLVFCYALLVLTVLVGMVNCVAIIRNIRFKK
ncbi:MAG: hypothetical protein H6753_00175 [Candidatus Omnitrophica bacterium]|nr:hypothetical protein [Candidatus Omnitrophota bacterium]